MLFPTIFRVNPFEDLFENVLNPEMYSLQNTEDLKKTGQVVEETEETKDSVIKRLKYQSHDGSRTITRVVSQPKIPQWSEEELIKLRDEAVENEDFERAIEYRNLLNQIKKKPKELKTSEKEKASV